jgi:hypothetical protein
VEPRRGDNQRCKQKYEALGRTRKHPHRSPHCSPMVCSVRSRWRLGRSRVACMCPRRSCIVPLTWGGPKRSMVGGSSTWNAKYEAAIS